MSTKLTAPDPGSESDPKTDIDPHEGRVRRFDGGNAAKHGTLSALEPQDFSTTKPDESDPRRFRMRQQWEGVVVTVSETELVVHLEDLSDPTTPREEAVLSIDELSAEDAELARPGAVFYWYIGYRTSPWGQRETISAIRFRRLPGWSKRSIKSARARASGFIAHFGTPQSATGS